MEVDDEFIWRLVEDAHNHNLPRESLLMQKVYRVCRAVADEAERVYDNAFFDRYIAQEEQIAKLQVELALARGEPPPVFPPMAQ